MSISNGQGESPDRLILSIKSAYSAALLIIAGMAFASYLLLQHMMATHQSDETLITLVSAQSTLTQRIQFLANAAQMAPPDEKRSLTKALSMSVGQFEASHDRILEAMATTPRDDAPGSAGGVLYAAPYHLDHFSNALSANVRRFMADLETRMGIGLSPTGYQAGAETARLDEAVISATMAGYRALRESLSVEAESMLERMLNAHRALFLATLVVICLVAYFIFRPVMDMIRRKTGELVEAHNSMARLAVHDGLTGLHNRTFMRDHFDALIKLAHRRREQLAVIQIDLDKFKPINDTLGHAAGDFVLVTTAERMKSSCRASDVCARLGGDEFIMVMSAAGNPEDIDGLANRILAKLNEPIVYEGATIFCGASAGIAVYPLDADNAGDLMVHADLALYAAKKQGGGTLSFFSDELRQELEHRKQLERDIAQAIEQDAFTVYFQPQVSLTNGAITGVEALVRWHHAERGMIAPSEFIPVAEKSGHMPAIGRIVMRKAIAEGARWHREGYQFGRIAINVSGCELREAEFTKFLFATMEQAGLPAHKLALEIVESVILDDEKTGIASKLRMIRAAGVHLELDDFGTGYASLSHVNPNEIDRLKIDRRFVQNINLNDDNSKIVRAITELARGLGISIVAEGAETDEELSSLLSIGCDQVQGYSVAFPMPDIQAREWLAARSPRRPVLKLIEGAQA